MKTTTERLRVADSEPLVLAVSAISDFLWPEFIRESKPHVSYIEDRFDIKQLSRFGKELFEFFYCGGDVNPLVSFDDIEEYFRNKQEGTQIKQPKKYKPENALWAQILSDVADHPSYSVLQQVCAGDHFNSGNNAVCVLNELSNVVENMLEASPAAHDALTNKTNELNEVRAQFVKAMGKGETKKAAELRQKGKELGQEIENALLGAHADFKPAISNSIEQGVKQAKDIENAMSFLAGDQKGVGVRLTNVEEKNKLARKLRSNRKLIQFAQRLGALKRCWTDRKRAKRVQSKYSDIVGAKLSNDVTRSFISEIALAGTPQGRKLFALKHAERTLLTKDYEAKSKDVGKGPVVMYIDISGSMSGASELWSKAIAYVVAEECLKTNRDAHVHLFDVSVEHSIKLKPGGSNADLLQFIMEWFTRGGTSFNEVMKNAYSRQDIDPKADILIITDGEAEVRGDIVRRFNLFKTENSIDVHAFCIGTQSKTLSAFCDTVQIVNTSEDADSSDLFLKAID